jgi:hypothetical protein
MNLPASQTEDLTKLYGNVVGVEGLDLRMTPPRPPWRWVGRPYPSSRPAASSRHSFRFST